MSEEQEVYTENNFECTHSRDKQVPRVLGSPFVTLNVTVDLSEADGSQVNTDAVEEEGLARTRDAVLACLDDRFEENCIDRVFVAKQLEQKITLLAQRPEVSHCEIDQNARLYYVGDGRIGRHAMTRHHASWLKVTLERNQRHSDTIKRQRRT